MPRLELVEASLRHGQQALLLSRLRQRHAVRAAALLDVCGFAALEVLGGPSFESQLRFLGEDPFQRLRAIREAAPRTTLAASLAGQALVGHRQYPDDVVDAFIRHAVESGIDLFRLHDPLNDAANLERSIAAVKDAGRQVDGVIVHTDTPAGRLTDLAARFAAMGADRLTLHDPLGSLAARRAVDLAREIGEASGGLPVGLSLTAQAGQAGYAYQAGAIAGVVSRADVCVAALGGGAAYPAAEAVVNGLSGTDADPELDLNAILAVSEFFEAIAPLYVDLADPGAWRLDTAALRGQLPVSLMGHGLAELRERNALDRLPEVESEIAQVRADLGHPPLVSPFPEILSSQAVYNVTDGDRYATVSQEVKDYCLGLFGQPPVAIDGDVRRLVNGREEPITCRPADLLEPQMDRSRRDLKREGVRDDGGAALLHALFPDETLALLHGAAEVELLGDEIGPEIPEIAEHAPPTVESAPDLQPAPAEEVRELRVEVDGQTYAVRVFGQGLSRSGGKSGEGAGASSAPVIAAGAITAPMQGLILKVAVKKGDSVSVGDLVAVLEAMKMQNDVTATRAGTVSAVYVQEGDIVGPKDPIVAVS
ncbi:MAG: pyruvate carboxylase subunit B [Candidatus Dormibacteria bacterium]